MADCEIKLPEELLSSLMSESTGFAQLLGSVLNQVLEARATEQIGADRYDRNPERGGYRNGVRSRVELCRKVGDGSHQAAISTCLIPSLNSTP